MSDIATSTIGLIPCLICSAENQPQAVLCRECSAPLALTVDSAAQGRAPQIITVVGESNVGKTVYLGFLLDMLSQRAGEFEAIPRGSFSVELQQNVISHMAMRVFPPKTPMEADEWQWAYYLVRSRQSERWFDLVMPDMAGESLAAEVATPDTFLTIRSLLSKSQAVILCIDAAMAANGLAQPDMFALKMMSYIDSIAGAVRNRRITTPVAVVLCKSDYCPEAFDAPRRFAEANLSRLWHLCQSRFETVEFFASSVVGSVGYATSTTEPEHVVPVPLHTALRGVLEPFEWIIDQL